MAFQKVATLDDLWSGEKLGVMVAARRVLLINIDGTVYAYEDRCAHLGVALSDGSLQDTVLTCRAHCWAYDVCTGRGYNPPRPVCRRWRCGWITAVSLSMWSRRGLPHKWRRGVCQECNHMADVEHNTYDYVGPVLQAGEVAEAVTAAIRQLNNTVIVLDRGAYQRVLVPGRCVLTRVAVEAHLGRSLRFPGDLEKIMPAFQGSFTVSEAEAVWACKTAPTCHEKRC